MMTDFRWTKQREKAALLLAEDQVPDEQIAAELGIGRTTLNRWRRHPKFQARVQGVVEAERVALLARGIAERGNRLDTLDDLWRKLRQVIQERGEDPANSATPGGRTGLLARTPRVIGVGHLAERIGDFAFDAALVRELRATLEQARAEVEGADLENRVAALEGLLKEKRPWGR